MILCVFGDIHYLVLSVFFSFFFIFVLLFWTCVVGSITTKTTKIKRVNVLILSGDGCCHMAAWKVDIGWLNATDKIVFMVKLYMDWYILYWSLCFFFEKSDQFYLPSMIWQLFDVKTFVKHLTACRKTLGDSCEH